MGCQFRERYPGERLVQLRRVAVGSHPDRAADTDACKGIRVGGRARLRLHVGPVSLGGVSDKLNSTRVARVTNKATTGR